MTGLEEILTLQRLGLADELGRSFKTTNVIESVNAGVGQQTDKVDRWRNRNQIQRRVAAAALEVESWLHKVCGYKHLAKRQAALRAIDQAKAA